ncbi:MAG: HEAT repeat domain-containing protein, partial [Actinomycetota bacterium]|nr:HEAT repeat domain-containing protein [Actinomycetota bacterium]
RWYLVRNAVLILCRAGVAKDVLSELEGLTRHEHPAVRREALRGLVPVEGVDAMSHLRRMVKDPDDTVCRVALNLLGGLDTPIAFNTLVNLVRTGQDASLRLQALDELAGHRTPKVAETLAEMASIRSRPRLPRALRHHARALSRRAGAER